MISIQLELAMPYKSINWLVIFFCLCCPASLPARLVSDLEVEKAARQWLFLENSQKQLRATPADISLEAITPWWYEGRKIGYVATLAPSGFILVPAATELPPIQFISYGGTFSQTQSHPFFQILRQRLAESLEVLGYGSEEKASSFSQNEIGRRVSIIQNQAAWERLLADPLFPYSLTAGERVPLLTSTWNQDSPYFNYTPVYNSAHCPVGCTATALAQIMYYWKHPVRGQGSHTYNWVRGAMDLSANFDHDYDWADMNDHYAGGEPWDAVARLMSDAGIAVDMDYCSPLGSAAHSYTNNALVAFFKYSDMATMISYNQYDSWQAWFDVLKEQLDNRWPVILTVYNFNNNPVLGHTLVVDGYRTDNLTNLVHVNLGWGGLSDGYYSPENIYRSQPSPDFQDYALINIIPNTYQPSVVISGTVKGTDELPVTCAEPQFWKENASGVFTRLKSTRTLNDGRYSAPLSPGRYKIYFNAEIANWDFTRCHNGGRQFNSQWHNHRGSLNWDMFIDDAVILAVNPGDRLTIDATLERACYGEFPNCPTWFQPMDQGDNSYLFLWGSSGSGCSLTDAYQLQRATRTDFSDAQVVYRGYPPPFYLESGLLPGTYHYRIRGENYCAAGLWLEYLNHRVENNTWLLYLPLIVN
ncbi:MAG: C10 family peptidase [Deltaproteobacteria bacterium]|nr:C10 family peptidase [Deltaproteobacteria bacterium]